MITKIKHNCLANRAHSEAFIKRNTSCARTDQNIKIQFLWGFFISYRNTFIVNKVSFHLQFLVHLQPTKQLWCILFWNLMSSVTISPQLSFTRTSSGVFTELDDTDSHWSTIWPSGSSSVTRILWPYLICHFKNKIGYHAINAV